MKILWIFRNTNPIQFDSEFVRIFEKVIGKNNIVFYGVDALPTHDTFGMLFYPTEYKSFDNTTFKEVVKEEKPDVVMATKDYVDTSGIDIPVATMVSDAHTEWLNRKLRAKSGQIDVVFLRNWGGGIAYRAKTELCPTVGYCPFSVSSTMFTDMEVERKYDVYFSGVHNYIYPLRVYMRWEKWDNYKCISDNKSFGYREYLNALNESKLVAFDTGLFKYAVMKFFEVATCNALIMSNLPSDWKALRFKPDVNMVEINFHNFKEKIDYYLQEEEERRRIARNGMELVLKYHTCEARSEQLLAQLKEVINAKNEERTFDIENVKGEAGEMLRILSVNKIFKKDLKNLLNASMSGCNSTDEELATSSALDKWYKHAIKLCTEINNGKLKKERWVRFIGNRNL